MRDRRQEGAMTPAWSAERTVSADLARSLIEAQFPSLAPAAVAPLGVGWDNTAFLANEAHVFRFPRRQIAVPLLDLEARLLPALARRLPLAVPVPTFLGRPTDAYPWPFAGYPLLPGRDAPAAALDDSERSAAAEPLGRFLAALHAVPADEAARLGAGPDSLDRLNIASRVPRAREILDRFTHVGLIDDAGRFAALLDVVPTRYAARADTLVHGDFYARHLLVGPDRRLAGVIDWGDIHLGDPAVDLMIAHVFLPPSAHVAFRAAYGLVGDVAWRLARLRGLWHTLQVLGYAHDVGDADLLWEARRALDYLAS
jgi:aminoglycoside phosphotransferase (APT) family kinase protein